MGDESKYIEDDLGRTRPVGDEFEDSQRCRSIYTERHLGRGLGPYKTKGTPGGHKKDPSTVSTNRKQIGSESRVPGATWMQKWNYRTGRTKRIQNA